MWKRALIYGASIAVASTLLTAGIAAAGLDTQSGAGQILGLLGFLIPIVGIVLAIRAARASESGEFTFGDGFKQGATVSLVAALLGAVLSYLYLSAINPAYLETLRETALTQVRAQQGLSERELRAAEAMSTGMLSPGAISGLGFVTQLIFGLIVSAVAALFMRRKTQGATGDGYGG